MPTHADLVGKKNEALGLDLFAEYRGDIGQLGPVAKEAKHSQTVACGAARPQWFAREVYCTVTVALYAHFGVASRPTKLV
jgi:hypothetical protein